MLDYTTDKDTWQPATSKEASRIITLFQPAKAALPYLKTKKHPLSFYGKDSIQLYSLTDTASLPPVTRYAIADISNNQLFPIDWSLELILEANKTLNLKLTKDNAIPYIKFALEFTRGPYGRLILIESTNDIAEMPNPPIITPLKITDAKANGSFTLNATLLFEGAIINSTLNLSPNGHIEITNQKTISQSAPDFFDPLALR